MLPLYRNIAISILENTPLSEDLNELHDENLMRFFESNRILETLYEEGVITWQGDFMVLKNVKSKDKTVINYWDEIKKQININGLTVDEWDKSFNMRGRWTCYDNNLVQIGKLLKKGYSYKQIADTLSYVATTCGQYTEKLTKQFDLLVFKQNFDKKDMQVKDHFTKIL